MFEPVKTINLSIEVMRSKFIAIIKPINKSDVNKLINDIKREYSKAKHYLYAYKLNNISKSNDDGEPGNIAKNFLYQINQNNLDNILIVVVRYFGGVKLGASRLSSTYINLVNDLIKKIEKYEIVDVNKYSLELDYSKYNTLKNMGLEIENVLYFDKIKCDLISSEIIDGKLNSLGIFEYQKTIEKRRIKCLKQEEKN